MLFLCDIENVFEIPGRGCIVVPGVPYELPPAKAASIRVGTGLLIVAPDGTELRTTLMGLEMVNRGRPMNHIPFCVPRSIEKSQLVQQGSKVYALVT